jgi:hypothetical protein
MNVLTSTLFIIAIDLIDEFVQSINPLTIERHRVKGHQTETEERPRDCSCLNHSHSKLLLEGPRILSVMSLTIENGDQNVIPHKILASHWLLPLSTFACQ